MEAVLSEGEKEIVKKEEYFTLFEGGGLRWPVSRVKVWDVEGKLEPYLKERGIGYERWEGSTERPEVIVVTPFTELWRKPEEFRRFIKLFNWVERGCAAVFLGLPSNGTAW